MRRIRKLATSVANWVILLLRRFINNERSLGYPIKYSKPIGFKRKRKMKKDGHTDVASSRRMCKTIIEDANDIVDVLYHKIWKHHFQLGGLTSLLNVLL